MYRTEVPLNRTFDRYYQGDYNEMEEQLLAIKSEVDQLLFYFESQHQMGLAAASKGAPWDARTGPAVARGAGLAFLAPTAGRATRAPATLTAARTNGR
jgi:hypothetical protein